MNRCSLVSDFCATAILQLIFGVSPNGSVRNRSSAEAVRGQSSHFGCWEHKSALTRNNGECKSLEIVSSAS